MILIGNVLQSSVINFHRIRDEAVPLLKVCIHHIKKFSLLRDASSLIFSLIIIFLLNFVFRKTIYTFFEQLSDSFDFFISKSFDHLPQILKPDLVLVRPREYLNTPLENTEWLLKKLTFCLEESDIIQEKSWCNYFVVDRSIISSSQLSFYFLKVLLPTLGFLLFDYIVLIFEKV